MLKRLSIAFVLCLFLAAGWLLWAVEQEAKGPSEAEPPEAKVKPVAGQTLPQEPAKAPSKPRPAYAKDLENLKKELLAQMKKLSQRLDTGVRGLQIEIDHIKRDMREDFRVLKDLPKESLGLKDEVNEVKRSLRDAQSQIRSLQRENDQLRQDVDALQRELRYLKRKIR